MSSELNALIAAVDAASAEADDERRGDFLRKVAALFTSQAERLGVDQVCAFDVVLVHLLRGVGPEQRAELAQNLAHIPNAPSKVVHQLAFDTAGVVAAPMLQHAIGLSEDDLVTLAERGDHPHLVALARRTPLTKRVTEALVKRSDRDALRALAENEGAALSDWTQTSLVHRALSDLRLCTALEKRHDLSPAHRKRLTDAMQHQTERLLDAEFGFSAQLALQGQL